VSAKEVQRTIGVTYKTAWRMCRLIRDYMGYVDGDDMIGGPDAGAVEIDHAFIGGEARTGENDKKVVLGIVEKNGNVVARHIPNLKDGVVQKTLRDTTKPGTHVGSDTDHAFTAMPYRGLNLIHTSIKGRGGEFSKDGHTTKMIEGFWSLVQRGINGTYVSDSQKHLQTYLGEFEFRCNMRHNPHLVLPLLMAPFKRGV
jgi:hypothetical protein